MLEELTQQTANGGQRDVERVADLVPQRGHQKT
jgi:hypothetical protein